MIGILESGLPSGGLCVQNNNSIEHLKECLQKKNVYIKNKSIKKSVLWNNAFIFNFVHPEDGSIKFSYANTFRLRLDPTFEYSIFFFDKNFKLVTINPDIVRRNSFIIRKRSVVINIFLRVTKLGFAVLVLFFLSGN